MIEKVRVRGFQSLRNVTLDLGRFTVIVGESGCGKSGFIRAFHKLVGNHPVSGTAAGQVWTNLPPGAGSARVDVEVDGHVVTWRKGTDSGYTLDGKKFSKVGRDCPEEIQEILRMPEAQLDGGETYWPNFHSQFSLPFLLDDAGSRVARVLGAITNVNLLYGANRESQRLRSAAQRELSVRQGDLEKQRDLLTGFKNLRDERELSTRFGTLNSTINEQVEDFKVLAAVVQRFARVKEEAEIANDDLTSAASVDGLLPRIDKTLKVITWLDKATEAITAELVAENDVWQLNRRLEWYARVKLPTPESLSARIKHLDDLDRDCNRLRSAETATEASGVSLERSRVAKSVAEDAWDTFTTDHPLCPICNNEYIEVEAV